MEDTVIDTPAAPDYLPPDPGLTLDPGGITLPLHLQRGLVTHNAADGAYPTPLPSQGRIVRYVRPDATFRAAIIADVVAADGPAFFPVLTLAVIEPGAAHLDPQTDVPYDPSGQQPHSWHWPSRS